MTTLAKRKSETKTQHRERDVRKSKTKTFEQSAITITEGNEKNVLITGGDTGLGFALDQKFLGGNDYRTYITVRQRKVKGSGEIVHSDLLNFLAETKVRFAIVVLNHGINQRAASWEEHLFHNLIQPINIIEKMIRGNRLSEGAIICTVLSEAAWKPMTRSMRYNTSKAAMMMATQQMARQCTKEKKGYSVFGVAPGRITDTYMTKSIDRQIMLDNGWDEKKMSEYREQRFLGHGFPAATYASIIYDMLVSDGVQCLNGSIVPLCFVH